MGLSCDFCLGVLIFLPCGICICDILKLSKYLASIGVMMMSRQACAQDDAFTRSPMITRYIRPTRSFCPSTHPFVLYLDSLAFPSRLFARS